MRPAKEKKWNEVIKFPLKGSWCHTISPFPASKCDKSVTGALSDHCHKMGTLLKLGDGQNVTNIPPTLLSSACRDDLSIYSFLSCDGCRGKKYQELCLSHSLRRAIVSSSGFKFKLITTCMLHTVENTRRCRSSQQVEAPQPCWTPFLIFTSICNLFLPRVPTHFHSHSPGRQKFSVAHWLHDPRWPYCRNLQVFQWIPCTTSHLQETMVVRHSESWTNSDLK